MNKKPISSIHATISPPNSRTRKFSGGTFLQRAKEDLQSDSRFSFLPVSVQDQLAEHLARHLEKEIQRASDLWIDEQLDDLKRLDVTI